MDELNASLDSKYVFFAKCRMCFCRVEVPVLGVHVKDYLSHFFVGVLIEFNMHFAGVSACYCQKKHVLALKVPWPRE